VSLIENEDLVPITGWRKDRSLTQISSVINTVVTSGINFNYIE
jgi:hypothetical protein